MDRRMIYSEQGVSDEDHLLAWKYKLIALGRAVEALLGGSGTSVYKFDKSQQTVPNLTINLSEGQIYQLADIDSEANGVLGSDLDQILQQGFAEASVQTFNTSGLSPGQAKWALVQVGFAQEDDEEEVKPFYNSDNPEDPLEGPGGDGGELPSVRKGVASISINYGAAATAGSHVPPAVSANCVPLYLISLTFGQTAITDGQILVAGPDAYSGYQQAPFLKGLLGSHHHGIAGEAPQIDLTEEVDGVLPLANCPGTSAHDGALLLVRVGTGNPNGNYAGGVGDGFFQTDNSSFWLCSEAGDEDDAVWINVSNPGSNLPAMIGPLEDDDLPYVIGNTYSTYGFNIDSDQTQALPSAASMAGAEITIVNDSRSAGTLTLDANGSEVINGNLTLPLNPGDSYTLRPYAGYGWIIV